MNNKIGPHSQAIQQNAQARSLGGRERAGREGGKSFGQVMSGVADVALNTTSAVAPLVPGGQLVGLAARGIQALRDRQPSGMGSAPGDQIDKMWEMQEQNQVFNMQYMQLQQSIQADNRNFSTMSNLLKVRHDTAKAAINNMHA